MLWKLWAPGSNGSMFAALWVEADSLDDAARKARKLDPEKYWAVSFQPMDEREREFAERIGGVIR